MFEHITYIVGAYAAATITLTWCALAPIFRTRVVRARLRQALSRTADRSGS